MQSINIFTQYRGLPLEIYIILLQRLVNSLGSFVFPFLTLLLSKKIAFTENEVGRFLMIVLIVSVPGVIISGKLVDKYNRKGIIVTSSYISAVILII